jgi:hypothetical protein
MLHANKLGAHMAFTYRFEARHPEVSYEERAKSLGHHNRGPRKSRVANTPKPLPPLSSGIAFAIKKVGEIGQVGELPQASRNAVLKMTEFMMKAVNKKVGENFRAEEFWGLYILGDRRIQGQAQPQPYDELELLSVGTLGRELSFTDGFGGQDIDSGDPASVFYGFSGVIPRAMPERYKSRQAVSGYHLDAYHKEIDGVTISLGVVDVPYDAAASLETALEDYDRNNMDVPRTRLPLVELTVPVAPKPAPPRFERQHSFYY